MKKTGFLKKVVAVVAMGAMMACTVVGCGGAISIDDIKGDWTLNAVAGTPVAEYAEAQGVTPGMIADNWTITEDKKLSITNTVTGTTTYDIELCSDGFNVYGEGAEQKEENVSMGVKFDKDKATLSFTGAQGELTYTKGTTELEAAAPAADEGGEEEAMTDEGGEEEYSEEEAAE